MSADGFGWIGFKNEIVVIKRGGGRGRVETECLIM